MASSSSGLRARDTTAAPTLQACTLGMPTPTLIGICVGALVGLLLVVVLCCLCRRQRGGDDMWRKRWVRDALHRKRHRSREDDEDTAELDEPGRKVSSKTEDGVYPEVAPSYGAYAPLGAKSILDATQAAYNAAFAAVAVPSAAPPPQAPPPGAASYNSNAAKSNAGSARIDAMYPRGPISIEPSASGFGGPASRGPAKSQMGVSFTQQSKASARWRMPASNTGLSRFTQRTGQSGQQGTIAPTIVDSNAGSSFHGGSSVRGPRTVGPGSRAPGSSAAGPYPAAPRSDGGSSYKGDGTTAPSDVDIASAYGRSHAGASSRAGSRL